MKKLRAIWRFSLLRQYLPVLLLLGLCAVTSLIKTDFLSWYNLVENLLTNAVPLGIVACGMTLVMIGGGFDLSVASTTAVASVVTVVMFHLLAGANPLVAIFGALLVTLAAATALGSVNGTLIAYVGINPFVVTLSTMFVFRSIALILTKGGQSIVVPLAVFGRFRNLYWGSVELIGGCPVPYPVFVFLGVLAATFYLLRFTRFGYYIYALGGNENASWLAGIRTRRIKLTTYALCGFGCGLAGFLLAAQSRTAEAASLVGMEMEAIAAVIVGGTPLGGGVGSIFGTLTALLLLKVIDNLLTHYNVASEYRAMVTGAIILVMVVIDTLFRKRSRS